MKKHIYLSLLASALLFAACEISISLPDYIPGNPGVPNNTKRSFWAMNISNDSFYELEAVQLANGEYCTVWGETGNPRATVDAAEAMKTAYDRDIYPKMKSVFGIENYEYEGYNFDTMTLADAVMGDDDGKLCILLLDIKDGYSPNTSSGYVAGYFSWINFLSNNDSFITSRNLKSNERDMIYVDTYPAEPGDDRSNETLAHELQHLMNFVNDQVLRDTGTDVWLNEGLSSAAEWVYTGKPDTDRRDWYNLATTTHGSRISTGNNFFVWDPEGDLDDYATVNLFFQWLRLQTGGRENIYRTISRSSHYDYNAVVSSMNGYDDWPTLLKTWLAANYINAPSGPYGYMNDDTLKTVRARTAPSGTRSVNLYPGEGVYSITNTGFTMPSNNGNIRYAGLNRNSPAVNDTGIFASGALLTYNVDTNIDGRPQSGTTTGVAASMGAIPISLSVQAALSGPYKISAGDMLRRNGYEAYTPPLRLLLRGDKDN
jgi:hypothetical protein